MMEYTLHKKPEKEIQRLNEEIELLRMQYEKAGERYRPLLRREMALHRLARIRLRKAEWNWDAT